MASDKHMEKAREIVSFAFGREGYRYSPLAVDIAAALANAEREGMRRGYELGFRASGEGWNGEYPFGDQDRSPTSSPQWVIARDRTLSIEIDHSSDALLPVETDKTGEVANSSPASPVTNPKTGA